jgi:hypothetical protein
MIFRLGDMSPPPLWVVVLFLVLGAVMIAVGSPWLGAILIGSIVLLSVPRVRDWFRR